MPWLSFALGGDGVCFVHDAEGFGFMVGAFVLMHNHHFFSSRFQYQELRICLNVCCNCFHRDVLPSSIYMMLLRHLSFFLFCLVLII